jgi:hypothetical protein
MSFDSSTGSEAPEYEAFEAALEIAERSTKAAMLRVAKALGSDEKKHTQSDDSPSAVLASQ